MYTQRKLVVNMVLHPSTEEVPKEHIEMLLDKLAASVEDDGVVVEDIMWDYINYTSR